MQLEDAEEERDGQDYTNETNNELAEEEEQERDGQVYTNETKKELAEEELREDTPEEPSEQGPHVNSGPAAKQELRDEGLAQPYHEARETEAAGSAQPAGDPQQETPLHQPSPPRAAAANLGNSALHVGPAGDRFAARTEDSDDIGRAPNAPKRRRVWRADVLHGTCRHTLRGINIQQCWCELIYSGAKTIEARKYQLHSFKGEWLWAIETPNTPTSGGRTQAAITGMIKFSGQRKYISIEEWRYDRHRHHIQEGSDLDWDGVGEMFAWHITEFKQFDHDLPPPDSRGQVSASACERFTCGCSPASRTPTTSPARAPAMMARTATDVPTPGRARTVSTQTKGENSTKEEWEVLVEEWDSDDEWEVLAEDR